MRTKVNAFLRGSMRVLGLAVVAAMMAACERTMIGEDWDALRNVNGSADVDGSGDASGAAGKQALKVMTRSGDGESAELTRMSDGTVSTLSTSAVYVRPVATVTVSKE